LISEAVGRDLHLGLEQRNKVRDGRQDEITGCEAAGPVAPARDRGEYPHLALGEQAELTKGTLPFARVEPRAGFGNRH